VVSFSISLRFGCFIHEYLGMCLIVFVRFKQTTLCAWLQTVKRRVKILEVFVLDFPRPTSLHRFWEPGTKCYSRVLSSYQESNFYGSSGDPYDIPVSLVKLVKNIISIYITDLLIQAFPKEFFRRSLINQQKWFDSSNQEPD